MPWCPKCGAEYKKGIETCTTCNLPLRSAPPLDETVTHDEDDLVKVCNVGTVAHAEIIQGLLETNGIRVMVRDNDGALRGLYPSLVTGSVDVLVFKNDFDKASTLISDHLEWSEDELTEFMERSGVLDLDEWELDDEFLP
jgi:hypothetical protein